MGFFSSLFDPGDPYKQAQKQYKKSFSQAQGYQNPFYNAGTGAIPQYQQWLGGMQNPSQFINQQMGNYQQSPYAQYQQKQAMRAAQNMGSAQGLTGSTPLMQFAQQNARDISSQDQQQWLQNVLGINQMYGSGLGGLMQSGQQAADILTNFLSGHGQRMGEAAYGKGAARQGAFWDTIGGFLGM